MPIEGRRGGMRPIFQKMQESCSKVGHAAREIATAFSVVFLLLTLVDQSVKTPPLLQCQVLRHISV